MEISLLKVLLNNMSSFLQIPICDDKYSEPVEKYYRSAGDTLKLLKTILDAIVNTDLVLDDVLSKAFEELGHLVGDLKVLFKNWQPLSSKVYFVLQFDSLLSKVQTSGLDIFEYLKLSHLDLPDELNSASIEHCVQKFKHIGRERMSSVIKEALRDQVEGVGPSRELLVKIAENLHLKSNQEILIEAVALEKVKENAEQTENTEEAEYVDDLITLVTRMHDRLAMIKQSQSCSPVPIPTDFCCPLSLELMTDPVIVASGQTYERAHIREWLDLGLTMCPKTRKTLAHTNLIPNYTVKALIANWCELNNVKLPDPVKPSSFSQPLHPLTHADSYTAKDTHNRSHSIGNHLILPESGQSISSPRRNTLISSGHHREGSPIHPHSTSESSFSGAVESGECLDLRKMSLSSSEDGSANIGERTQNLVAGSSTSPSGVDQQLTPRHDRTVSDSSSVTRLGEKNEALRASSHLRANSSGPSVLEKSGPQTATVANPRVESELPSRVEPRGRNQSIWRRPSDRFAPRIVSTPAAETRADLSGVEAQVRNLVENLKSTSIETQREATAELRLLARNNMDNRIVIGSSGAIAVLVDLLRSADTETQENAVTALLNLSINDNNKTAIGNADAIEPLIHVLETGSPEAKENAAATLFSLSVVEDNKIKIGRSGAIRPLVELLGNGTPRGKKDAATALFNLSIHHENKARIVQAGAVKHLVDLMDPAAGMVDKAVAVLANLATIPDGRTMIGQEGGIPVLVEVVELGSPRGKENAAAALLQLCTTSSRYCHMVLQEGAVPPLVALSQSGTPRAREKAQALLSCFRNQRHGNAGRG